MRFTSKMTTDIDLPGSLYEVLEQDGDILIRPHGKPLNTRNMEKEFLWVLEELFGHPFVDDEWRPSTDRKSKDGDGCCICSHHITKLFFIQHVPTGITLQVGCDCVKKVSERLGDILDGRSCKQCGKRTDARRTCGKLGYCSDECNRKARPKKVYKNPDSPKVPTSLSYGSERLGFGKYSLKTYEEVKDGDPNYCRWVLSKPPGEGGFGEFQAWLRSKVRN